VAVADRGATKGGLAPGQVIAPGDDVGAGHGAEFLKLGNAREPHEIADRVLVGAPGAGVADISEPFGLRLDVLQPVKLFGGQEPFGRSDFRRELGVGHGRNFNIDKNLFSRETGAELIPECEAVAAGGHLAYPHLGS
jgi:hypothetical protein